MSDRELRRLQSVVLKELHRRERMALSTTGTLEGLDLEAAEAQQAAVPFVAKVATAVTEPRRAA